MRQAVARTVLPDGRILSTAYLHEDHNPQGSPELYESVLFGPSEPTPLARYCCRDWALRGHVNLSSALRAGAFLVYAPYVCAHCMRPPEPH